MNWGKGATRGATTKGGIASELQGAQPHVVRKGIAAEPEGLTVAGG